MADNTFQRQQASAQAPSFGEEPSASKSISKAISNLSMREKVLIWALIIVALVMALVFLLILPANDRLVAAQSEREVLRSEETTAQMTIAGVTTQREILENAQVKHAEYLLKYQAPLLPEDIDKMVTTVIQDCGFTAGSLTLNPLTTEGVPVFGATPTAWGLSQSLLLDASTANDAGLAAGSDTAASSTEANTSTGTEGTSAAVTGSTNGETTNDGTTNDSVAAAEVVESATDTTVDSSGEAIEGPLVQVYNVQVTVVGCEDSFFAFLDRVLPLSWIKVSGSTFAPYPTVVTDATSLEQTYTFDLQIFIDAAATAKPL